jgi:hypothetical protein
MTKLAEKPAEKSGVQPVSASLAIEVRQPSSSPTREEIEVRAYEIYERRGRIDGNDVEDWLQAESELLQEAAGSVSLVKAAAA